MLDQIYFILLSIGGFGLAVYTWKLIRYCTDLEEDNADLKARAYRLDEARARVNYLESELSGMRSFIVQRGYLKDYIGFTPEITLERVERHLNNYEETGPPWDVEVFDVIRLPDRRTNEHLEQAS